MGQLEFALFHRIFLHRKGVWSQKEGLCYIYETLSEA